MAWNNDSVEFLYDFIFLIILVFQKRLTSEHVQKASTSAHSENKTQTHCQPKQSSHKEDPNSGPSE